jgi:hypothetical protein
MRAHALVCLWLLAVSGQHLHAQTISAEIDLTAGYSGEEVRAAASQLRLFGEAPAGVSFFVDTAWGDRWAGGAPVIGESLNGADPIGTDVFGAAYPYGDRVKLIEAYAERYFKPRGTLLGVRAGRFRTPFGIYGRSDHGYTGFVRPPLIRYDGYYGVSNNWLEEGVTLTAGVPQLFVEGSISRPRDAGFAIRRAGTNGSVRVQGYRGPLIVGVSHARSNPYLPARFAVGRQAFNGLDVRWTHSAGVQARGELLKGHSHEGGVSTTGWYIDGFVHRPGMGPFTAVIRGESLTYTAAAPRARSARRVTLGARVRWPGPVTFQLNYLRQRGDLTLIKHHSIDVSATYSVRIK